MKKKRLGWPSKTLAPSKAKELEVPSPKNTETFHSNPSIFCMHLYHFALIYPQEDSIFVFKNLFLMILIHIFSDSFNK